MTLEGEGVLLEELSEISQEHILYMVSQGFSSGEVVEAEGVYDAG